jgi:hypothetical protein
MISPNEQLAGGDTEFLMEGQLARLRYNRGHA